MFDELQPFARITRAWTLGHRPLSSLFVKAQSSLPVRPYQKPNEPGWSQADVIRLDEKAQSRGRKTLILRTKLHNKKIFQITCPENVKWLAGQGNFYSQIHWLRIQNSQTLIFIFHGRHWTTLKPSLSSTMTPRTQLQKFFFLKKNKHHEKNFTVPFFISLTDNACMAHIHKLQKTSVPQLWPRTRPGRFSRRSKYRSYHTQNR